MKCSIWNFHTRASANRVAKYTEWRHRDSLELSRRVEWFPSSLLTYVLVPISTPNDLAPLKRTSKPTGIADFPICTHCFPSIPLDSKIPHLHRASLRIS